MARVLNFSLTMKDGYKVERDIADLREHFDLETVLGLYKEGKLQRWLKRNGYAEEAAQLDDLDEDDSNFKSMFCHVLGVEAADHDAVDVAELSERTWRLRKLRDYTTDPYLLDLAENTAFSQEDLDTLIDEGAEEIVLCDGRFTIPLKARGTKYYGAGKAVAVIESDEIVDFERKYITFENVKFDENYRRILGETEGGRGGQEDAEEQLALAREYCEQGDDRCVAILERLAEDGNTEAMKILSLDWYDDADRGNDKDQAVLWMRRAADLGNPYAMLMIGIHLRNTEQYEEAFEYITKGAETGIAEGMIDLAGCYANGIGTRQDDEKALFWYKKAAEAGNVVGMIKTGDYLCDNGYAADARRWFEKATEEGDEELKGWAFYRLGDMYANGLLGAGNISMAVHYYQTASDFGCVQGTLDLANCYDDGMGVAVDKHRAASYFEQVAKDGNDEQKGFACLRLGAMYRDGELGEENYPRAATYFKKSADLGNESGVFCLAMCHQYGLGVKEDVKYAAQLYARAARAGIEEAAEALEELKKEEGGLLKDIWKLLS